ncbi:glycosyltransferase [Dickeya dianthicola]|uniref:glycosyltransferase n=1 Tax=Dickeya dianthicola TaxID=204039 RepID=UPI003015AE4B
MVNILRDIEIAIYWTSLMALCSIAIKIIYFYTLYKKNWLTVSLWGSAMLISFLGISWIYNDVTLAFYPLLVTLLASVAFYSFIPRLNAFGAGYLGCTVYFPVSIVMLLNDVNNQSHFSFIGQILAMMIQVYLIITIFVRPFFVSHSHLATLFIHFPRRDTTISAAKKNNPDFTSRVSIHLPCYSEPPHLVIKTLNSLAALNYPDFEVLVIDNNTKDDSLWLPVKEHCTELGPRFRFFHVDPLSGAKAGALNFALKVMDHTADIVAVVDADYIAEPDFLKNYIPLFQDKQVGFVQTSHDYREWQNSNILSGAYYEYVLFHKLILPAYNEYDGGYTVGTMCLLRREALEKVGGWAEWALTEDSEIAVRLHAIGYSGHVFADTWGRGLIPETMEAIKKQQFRWNAGPVEQFKKHWRLYLGLDNNGQLSFAQKILELRHSFVRLPVALGFVISPFLFLFAAWSGLTGVSVIIPDAFIILMITYTIISPFHLFLKLRLIGNVTLKNCIFNFIVTKGLQWTHIKGFLIPFFRSNLRWHRTDKFQATSNLARAWQDSRMETCLALIHFFCAIVMMNFASFSPVNIHAMLAIWFITQGLTFLCTLLAALLLEQDLARIQE